MLDSVPVPVQAILWPLIGAVVVLAANRLLPHWLGRSIASASALASLAALWSMRGGDVARVQLSWVPVGVFRTNPVIEPGGLALFGGVVLASITAASTLSIRGAAPRRVTWHGLLLVTLAGSLIVMMGGNLPTMAIGSALIDLSLIATAVLATEATDQHSRPAYSMIAAGLASTLLITFAALQMSARLGTTSVSVANVPVEVPILLSLAGMLRLMIYPLYPKRLDTPQVAITMLLLAGTGIYMISCAQDISTVLVSQQWPLFLGIVAIVAGGLLSWAGAQRSGNGTGTVPEAATASATFEKASDEPAPDEKRGALGTLGAGVWLGLNIHQTGLALLFLYLLSTSAPWPLLSLAVGLGLLAIWWDAGQEHSPGPHWPGVDWITQQARSAWSRGRAALVTRFPILGRQRASRIYQGLSSLLPAIGLTSTAGVPLTVGAVARWSLYGAVLDSGQARVLVALLVADTFLVTGLWQTLPVTWNQARRQKPGLPALLSMAALTILVLAAGIAPDRLLGSFGLSPLPAPDASIWGLGLVYILPWLVGVWLARVGARLVKPLHLLRDVVGLDWLYRSTGWLGQRLLEVMRWLGIVGEGDGWWGWALIILALGAVLLASR